MSDDLRAAPLAAAYRQMERRPPPPLLIPSWLPAVAAVGLGSEHAAHEWLDREARNYGFDGYVIPEWEPGA